jgi:hypothetical protein
MSTTARVTGGVAPFSPIRICFTPFRFTAIRRCFGLAEVVGRSKTSRSGFVTMVTLGSTEWVRVISSLILSPERTTFIFLISAGPLPCATHADANRNRLHNPAMILTSGRSWDQTRSSFRSPWIQSLLVRSSCSNRSRFHLPRLTFARGKSAVAQPSILVWHWRQSVEYPRA